MRNKESEENKDQRHSLATQPENSTSQPSAPETTTAEVLD
jgi:hypothetical protein